MNARVPTLPTPTTLRATSMISKRSSRWRRSFCSVDSVGAELLADHVLELVRPTSPPSAGSSRRGITIGGWLMIRYLPSTSSASLDSACRLSRVRALAAIALARFSPFFASFLLLPASGLPEVLDVREQLLLGKMRVPDVHRAHLRELRPSPPDRPARTRASPPCVSALVKPLLRPGDREARGHALHVVLERPGSVSSKSFTSNSSVRSGDAKMPKFDRCASPQSCTSGRRAACPSGRPP